MASVLFTLSSQSKTEKKNWLFVAFGNFQVRLGLVCVYVDALGFFLFFLTLVC